MQTQTNKLTEFVWSLLFLFARYKVQGCLVNKLNLNSSHVHFWNMSLKILYRARLKQGGWSGIRLTLSKCEMYPPKTAFSPLKFFDIALSRRIARAHTQNFKGAYPPAVFQNGILTHPILRWKNKVLSEVFSCRNIWKFRDSVWFFSWQWCPTFSSSVNASRVFIYARVFLERRERGLR